MITITKKRILGFSRAEDEEEDDEDSDFGC